MRGNRSKKGLNNEIGHCAKNIYLLLYYLVQNTGYAPRVEEGPEERAIGLDRREIGFHSGVEGLFLAKRRLGHAFLSQRIPDKLVRVEFGRVSGEEMEFQAAPLGLDEVGDHVSPVGGVVVQLEADRLPAPAEESLEECTESGAVQPPPEQPCTRRLRGDSRLSCCLIASFIMVCPKELYSAREYAGSERASR